MLARSDATGTTVLVVSVDKSTGASLLGISTRNNVVVFDVLGAAAAVAVERRRRWPPARQSHKTQVCLMAPSLPASDPARCPQTAGSRCAGRVRAATPGT
jgi:hypothetical protein